MNFSKLKDAANKLLEFEEAGNGNDYYIIYVDPIKQEEKRKKEEKVGKNTEVVR